MLTLRLFVCAVAALCLAAQDQPVFRSGVSLVRVDAEVVDAAGNIVPDLTKDDFYLAEDGIVQPVVNFSFEKEPLDLILLFDTGGGMRSKIHQVLRAVELGFHELQPGDRVCVMAYGSNSFEVAPFTADMDAVNATILLKVLGLKFGGESDMAAAGRDAALRFRREAVTARRRAILVIADKTGGSGSARALWQSDAVLAELVIGKPGITKVAPVGQNPLADGTGGATLIAGDPGTAFQDSLRRLRRRYTLYYAPADGTATERKIDLRLTDAVARRYPGATVRARTGYSH